MSPASNSGGESGDASPVEQAASKTAQVQQELAVAEAELHLTNTILDRALSDGNRREDVDKAVKQNAATEERVGQAAEELKEVTDLLEAEAAAKQPGDLGPERRAPS